MSRATSTPGGKPPLYKIVMLGDSGVGKTSLVARLTNPDRPLNHDISATMGIEFDTQMLDTPQGKVKAQIWDTAGQERFQSLGVGFYRGADACLLVYDVTDPHSLDNLDHWRKEFLDQVGGGIQGLGDASTQFPFVVVGNKIDKSNDRLVPREQAEEWCRTAAAATITGSQPLPHFEASAKTSESVEDAFQEAARRAIVYEEYKKRSQPQLFVPPQHGEPINLRRQAQQNEPPEICC
mmetsp:Transcript_14354/g.29708  ORF Transcript_14354/g.29708 Transcript_14354/m.29708 type:complete len:237 (-) Transcript_14354:607-1317(-)